MSGKNSNGGAARSTSTSYPTGVVEVGVKAERGGGPRHELLRRRVEEINNVLTLGRSLELVIE
jgi:hypothetical protein